MKELSDSRVLIVDDVKANIDVLVGALHDEYKLSVAVDGDAALRMVAKNPPDLVLLDIMMPGIDGYEVCRQLRAAKSSSEIPIMFLSSLEEIHDKTRGFEAGANDYLVKPFEILEVKARVKSLLKAKAYADAIREASERELRVAREIQRGILPQDVSVSAAGSGLDVCALFEPAKHVGGDLYEVLRATNDTIMIVIGDVMGKGVPAALFMAVTVTLLRTIVRQTQRPEEVLARLNDELEAQNPRRMFVTMSCIAIDVASGRATGASAGHSPLMMIPSSGPPRLVFPSSGMVLGMRPGQTFKVQTLDMTTGDTLLFYTDGITEAENVQEEQFESERLLQCFADGAGHSAAETASKLLSAVHAFGAGAPQTDDITAIAVRKL
jgi:sigma-B regulation protein RsbU (phosphoserine phosphatase)